MDMSGLKVLSATLVSTFVAFSVVIGMEEVGGQVTDSAFANCVMMSGGYTVDVIMLGTDEDCNDEQFEQAVNHYKAQGYTERQYSSMFGEKIMNLQK